MAQHTQLHGPPADPMAVKEFQEGMVQLPHTTIQNAVLGEYDLTEELFPQTPTKYSSALEACKTANVGFVLMLSVCAADSKGEIFVDQFRP